MCGIVGFITDPNQYKSFNLQQFITTALEVGTVRGEHASGIFYLAQDGISPGWLKHNVPGYSFVNSDSYEKIVNHIKNSRAAVGHNRYATRGSNTVSNAHPFQEGRITLVHNGTISSHGECGTDAAKVPKVDVDSHAITHSLNTHSVENVIKNLRGGFVLVWHDSEDNSINIIRNDVRPIHMAQVEGERTIVFASEAGMLCWVAERCNLRLGQVYLPKPGVLFKFLPNQTLKPVVRQLELAPAYEASDDYSYWFGLPSNNYTNKWSTKTSPYAESYETGSPADIRRRARAEAEASHEATKLFPQKGIINLATKVRTEGLAEVGLSPTEILMFTPTAIKAMPVGPNVMVEGILTPLGQTAAIYNLPRQLYEHNQGRKWKVQAAGVKWVSDSKAIVLCVLKGVVTQPSHTHDEPKDEPATKQISLVPGPTGAHIPIAAFERLTKNGCISCGGNILPEFADEVIWVNNNQDPLCPSCVEKWTNPSMAEMEHRKRVN